MFLDSKRPTARPRLLIIIGSTRPGRAGLGVGRWFAGRAEAHGGFEVQVVDLADLDLPFLDEPHHPRLGRYTRPHTKAWSATVDAADAVVIVTPEYNHGYPAALKNAIDYLSAEWAHKPVGFVSYGGVAAGTRAVQQLKPVVSILKMVPLSDAVAIPFIAQHLDERGTFRTTEALDAAAATMLDAAARWTAALATLRAPETAAV